MDKESENRIIHKHMAALKILQLPLFEELIPDYLQALDLDEQAVLLKRARKWLWRHWDKPSQRLKHQRYLASVGERNQATLCAYLFIVHYACWADSAAR